MMTQADIISKNEEPSGRPANLGDSFPDSVPNLSEQSPIRPNKYFANDSAINTSKGLRKIIAGGLVFSLIVTLALFAQMIFGGTQVPNRIGIVTSESVCSDIGAQMVRMGGNSVDAFIASSLCLSVVNPFAAGFGAGGFLVIRDHKHDHNLGINCFFKSSMSISPPKTDPIDGVKSIAIPGELKCLQYAYHKYARFYWKTLSAPAINLARNGFKVSSLLAQNLQKLEKVDFDENPIMAEIFLSPNGTLVKEGDVIQNRKLAEALEKLNRQDYVFYHEEGVIGQELVQELAIKNDGVQQITNGDLNQYSEQVDQLTRIDLDDFVLLTTSYPSAGPIIKYILELIKSFPTEISDLKTATFYERLLEATKLGYILASYVSDPNYGPNQEELYKEKFTRAKAYLESMNSSAEYPFERTNVKIKDDFYVNFISVNDHNDYMVSYVGTLGSVWGSRFMSKNGYVMNNALSLFSYDGESVQDGVNVPGTNRQPRGLMAPILTFNKKNPCVRRFSISYSHKGGTMDDDLAFSELAQVITKILTDFSLYETALVDKRLQLLPLKDQSKVCFENGFDNAIRTKIESEGKFTPSNSCMFHSIDLIMKKDHVVYGQADLTRSQDSLVVFN